LSPITSRLYLTVAVRAGPADGRLSGRCHGHLHSAISPTSPCGGSADVEPLAAELKDPSAERRREAVACLAKLKGEDAARVQMAEHLGRACRL